MGADLTYVRTWQGFVYLAFILDVFSRMIVGWQLATHMRTELVMDALEMANGLRRPEEGLIAHNDRGSQYTSITYTGRLDELASPVGRLARGCPGQDVGFILHLLVLIRRVLFRRGGGRAV